MSSTREAPDPDVERDIDLARWGRAVIAQWWVVVAGLVGGVVVGALFTLGGGSAFVATARIAPGQAFNPSGASAVLTYLTNTVAINEIATSETTLVKAAAAARMSVAQLRGHVTTAGANQTPGQTGARSAVLVDITVQLSKKKRAEDAANAIAEIVRQTTTSRYVRQSIRIYGERIMSFNKRLKTLQQRIDFLDTALKQRGLSLDQSLLLAIQLDQAQATQGQTIDSLATAQQQQILAEDVEQTQLIQGATAAKTAARTRRTSILVGGLIGLILGAIAAVVADPRLRRAEPS